MTFKNGKYIYKEFECQITILFPTFSLRAKYGTDVVRNALHTCDSTESAARELAFFFPDFNVPKVAEKRTKKRLQRTLALIRPNALEKNRDSIMQKIQEAGFLIAMEKEVTLSREQAEEFYSDHKGQDYFESLVNTMTRCVSLSSHIFDILLLAVKCLNLSYTLTYLSFYLFWELSISCKMAIAP